MSCRVRHAGRSSVAAFLLAISTSAFAVDTASITASALSRDCLAHRIVGVCYWLHCSLTGCDVRASVKVRHYVPDAVVSSYSNTGENPWSEIAFLSPPNSTAQHGGDGTTNEAHENNLAKFKNADVIGHPGLLLFNEFASGFGLTCEGAGQPFLPYHLSTFDVTSQ